MKLFITTNEVGEYVISGEIRDDVRYYYTTNEDAEKALDEVKNSSAHDEVVNKLGAFAAELKKNKEKEEMIKKDRERNNNNTSEEYGLK